MTKLPVFKTERLILREISVQDTMDMFEYSCSPLVGPMAGWAPHKTLYETTTVINIFIDSKNRGEPGVFAIVAIAGIVLSVQGFGDFESNNFMVGGMMSAFGIFATITCAMIGFRPEMAKMSTQSAKYIQQQNKEDLSEIASTQAEIMKEQSASHLS